MVMYEPRYVRIPSTTSPAPTITASHGMNSTIARTPSVNASPAVPKTTRKPSAIRPLTANARRTDWFGGVSEPVPRK